MRQPTFRRTPAWSNRVAALAKAAAGPAGDPACPGPLAPAGLRAEPPADGVRRGLVAFYRDALAAGRLDTLARLAAAEDALFCIAECGMQSAE